MDISTAKRQFLEYIEIEKGRSLKTVENYDRYLSTFLDFMSKNSPANPENPENVTPELLRQYRLWLNRKPLGITSNTKETSHSRKSSTSINSSSGSLLGSDTLSPLSLSLLVLIDDEADEDTFGLQESSLTELRLNLNDSSKCPVEVGVSGRCCFPAKST